jgi:ketosteroid isomerase-like protein
MRQISQNTILKMFYKIYICVVVVFGTRVVAQEVDIDSLQRQVRNAEIAFAQTMADRDFEAFKTFVSKEAVFFSGKTARRGRDQVVEHWKEYYQGEEAPFSWRPETVVVLGSGNLALSTGPVFNSSGKLTAYFTSTWRQEEPGVWRVIFDKGSKACEE